MKRASIWEVSTGEMGTPDKSRNSVPRDWTTATTHDKRLSHEAGGEPEAVVAV
jgi:hypothetical protein